jgi:DNA-binding NarL/FixJ family response regulator
MDVLVISDQLLARVGVRAQLQAIDPGLTVCEACDMGQAMARLNVEPAARLIVLDLDAHRSRPLMNTVLLRELWPDIPLVVMSSKPSRSALQQAQEAGVAAYFDKAADTALLREALKQVLAGRPPATAPQADTV